MGDVEELAKKVTQEILDRVIIDFGEFGGDSGIDADFELPEWIAKAEVGTVEHVSSLLKDTIEDFAGECDRCGKLFLWASLTHVTNVDDDTENWYCEDCWKKEKQD